MNDVPCNAHRELRREEDIETQTLMEDLVRGSCKKEEKTKVAPSIARKGEAKRGLQEGQGMKWNKTQGWPLRAGQKWDTACR